MAEPVNHLFPAGRMIWGDPYDGRKTDFSGAPLVVKNGPNVGQPKTDYSIGVAIRKGAEQKIVTPQGELPAFINTSWGRTIYEQAAKAFPQAIFRRDFAWKVVDGDSTEMNQNNKRPCDDPNQRGHWILKFSSGFAPKIVNQDGTQALLDKGVVYPGCFVQVFGSIVDNGQQAKPGVYLNLHIVSFQAHGERITAGPDAAAVGFGQGVQLPAGASAAPLGAMPQVGQVAAAPLLDFSKLNPPAATGLPTLPGVPQVAAAPAALPVLPVVPLAGFTQPVPTAPVIPPLPVAAPAAPTYVMTAKAGGATRAQFEAQGWNEEMLLREGYMAQG
jgi:hypothetical protein